MEVPSDSNVFPNIDLFPKLTHVAHALGSFLLERHTIPNSGGGPLLDALECPDVVENGQGTLW